MAMSSEILALRAAYAAKLVEAAQLKAQLHFINKDSLSLMRQIKALERHEEQMARMKTQAAALHTSDSDSDNNSGGGNVTKTLEDREPSSPPRKTTARTRGPSTMPMTITRTRVNGNQNRRRHGR